MRSGVPDTRKIVLCNDVSLNIEREQFPLCDIP